MTVFSAIAIAGLKRNMGESVKSLYTLSYSRKNNLLCTYGLTREGIGADIALLEELLNTNANEQAMQRFFEEHPALLMQSRLGIPVAHPTFTTPRRYSPDFAMTPILGAAHGDSAEFLELKGPDAPLLNNIKRHQGLSSALRNAMDQVRDYGRYLSDPQNAMRLIKKLGYLPTTPRLAVLIGRDLKDAAQEEVLERRETEALNVKIITYDEILEVQSRQLYSTLALPGDDDFPESVLEGPCCFG